MRNTRRALGRRGFDRCACGHLRSRFTRYHGPQKNDVSVTASFILYVSGTPSRMPEIPPVQNDCRQHMERGVSACGALPEAKCFARMESAHLSTTGLSEPRGDREDCAWSTTGSRMHPSVVCTKPSPHAIFFGCVWSPRLVPRSCAWGTPPSPGSLWSPLLVPRSYAWGTPPSPGF